VKNDENWKVFGACKALHLCLKEYDVAHKAFLVSKKKDESDDEEAGSSEIGLSLECERLKTRIQYLFNFIMNYRSRFAHQSKNRKNKFLIEEHQASYNQLCDKLKEAKALMDKMEVVPTVRNHDRQSLIYFN